ncbi:MAG: hypothetical protein HQ562_05495 [Candidatus Marinimicrobia bacterium]|nr:hypothetical protein [Candidatus Neomarinimicrobiota bacterium]
MGLFRKLFNSKSNNWLFETIASIIAITHSTCVVGEEMKHPQKQKIILCYYFGFIDFIGQMHGFNKDDILEVFGQVLKDILKITGTDYNVSIAIVMAGTQDTEGRYYMKTGADALADFLDRNTPTASMPLIGLLSEFE